MTDPLRPERLIVLPRPPAHVLECALDAVARMPIDPPTDPAIADRAWRILIAACHALASEVRALRADAKGKPDATA